MYVCTYINTYVHIRTYTYVGDVKHVFCLVSMCILCVHTVSYTDIHTVTKLFITVNFQISCCVRIYMFDVDVFVSNVTIHTYISN